MIGIGNEPLQMLAPEQIELVHEGAMRLLEEVGTRVTQPRILDLVRAQGQRVDDDVVRWDREFVMELVSARRSG